MPVPAAVKRIYDQGIACRPAPVHSGLVDTRPAGDGLHVEAVVALLAQLVKRGVQNGCAHPGAPAARSRLPFCRRLATHLHILSQRSEERRVGKEERSTWV